MITLFIRIMDLIHDSDKIESSRQNFRAASEPNIVSHAAVICLVTQRSSPLRGRLHQISFFC